VASQHRELYQSTGQPFFIRGFPEKRNCARSRSISLYLTYPVGRYQTGRRFLKLYTSTFYQHSVHFNNLHISYEFLEHDTLRNLKTKN